MGKVNSFFLTLLVAVTIIGLGVLIKLLQEWSETPFAMQWGGYITTVVVFLILWLCVHNLTNDRNSFN